MNYLLQKDELTDVFERITDAFVALDKNWCYTYMNKKAGEIFNCDPKQIIGRHIWTEFPEGADQPFRKAYEKAMGEQQYVYLEEYYPPYDRWFENHIYPSPEGLSIFLRDITEKKKAEAKIEASEKKLRQVLASTPDNFYVIDRNYNVIMINETAEKNLEKAWRKPVKVGTNLLDVIPANEEPIKESFEKVFTGKRIEYELHVSGDELPDWVLVSYMPVHDETGVITGAYVIAKDISERKKAEQTINFNEQQLKLIYNTASDIIFLLSIEGSRFKFTSINQAFLSSTGLKEDQIVGKYADQVIPLSSQALVFEKYRQAILSGETVQWEEQSEYPSGKRTGIVSVTPAYNDRDECTMLVGTVHDITERKKAEEATKESEERYRTLVENAPEALVVLDVEKRKFVSVSESAVKLFKMPKEELLKVGPIDLSPEFQPDGRTSSEAGFEKISEAVAGGKPSFEWMHSDAEGNLIPCEVWLVRLPAEKQILVRGSIIDIAERKKAQELIIRERDLSDSIINSLPGIFYLRDLSTGHCLRWNKNFEIVTGKKPQEIANSLLYDCIADEHKKLARQAVETAIKTKEGVAIEANLLTNSGQKIPYYITGIAINYENKTCLMGTGIDISARKKAEEELRESEQKYKLLFESNPLPMFMFSRNDFSIIDVNESAIRHYGFSRKEFLEMKMTDLRPQEDVSRFLEKVTASAAETVNLGVWRHKKKNGSVISVEIIGYDIIYKDKPARLVLANDVTEKLAGEEKLKQSYNEVRRLTNHLQNIREEERTHIAREIHDELGQQLTVLKMDASWLNKKLSSTDEATREKLKGLLEVLDGTVKTVRRISSELRPSLLDDLGLTAAIEWHLKEFEKRSGIQTNFVTEETDLPLPDEMKTGLFRILQESLTNVARHAGAKTVKVSLGRKDDELVLSIEDDGRGFDKFETASKKTLGVLGMEERSEMMGGNYQISSQPGAGTIVTVSIPFQFQQINK